MFCFEHIAMVYSTILERERKTQTQTALYVPRRRHMRPKGAMLLKIKDHEVCGYGLHKPHCDWMSLLKRRKLFFEKNAKDHGFEESLVFLCLQPLGKSWTPGQPLDRSGHVRFRTC